MWDSWKTKSQFFKRGSVQIFMNRQRLDWSVVWKWCSNVMNTFCFQSSSPWGLMLAITALVLVLVLWRDFSEVSKSSATTPFQLWQNLLWCIWPHLHLISGGLITIQYIQLRGTMLHIFRILLLYGGCFDHWKIISAKKTPWLMYYYYYFFYEFTFW